MYFSEIKCRDQGEITRNLISNLMETFPPLGTEERLGYVYYSAVSGHNGGWSCFILLRFSCTFMYVLFRLRSVIALKHCLFWFLFHYQR